MASIVNGFEPLHHFLDWRYGVGGGHVPSVVREAAPPDTAGEQRDPEKTGPQGKTGLIGWGFGEPLRGTPATYRQMLRVPSLSLVRNAVFSAILSGSWSVESDDDAPARGAEAIESCFVRPRVRWLRHGLRALDFGNAPNENVWTARDGLTLIEYPKPLRAGGDGTTIWVYENGQFAGLSTSTDKNRPTDRPTISGDECFLWTYDAEPGDYFGRARLENVREACSKWFEIQNRIGALAKKEAGSVVKTSFPPNDLAGGDARAAAEANAASMASGSGYIVTPSALHAFTKRQREQADPKDLVRAMEIDLWGAANLSLGGNSDAIEALQAYAAYLDVQIIRGYLQPERSLIEGTTGTKAEAGVHTDTGTTDCERVEADFVEALNCGPVDDVLEANWGPQARGKVRIVAHPLRDVQEEIDRMLIQNVSTNTATADEFYRTFDFDAVAERRGIPKRKTPLPKPEPVTPPAGGVNGTPQKVNGDGSVRLAASRIPWDEDE